MRSPALYGETRDAWVISIKYDVVKAGKRIVPKLLLQDADENARCVGNCLQIYPAQLNTNGEKQSEEAVPSGQFVWFFNLKLSFLPLICMENSVDFYHCCPYTSPLVSVSVSCRLCPTLYSFFSGGGVEGGHCMQYNYDLQVTCTNHSILMKYECTNFLPRYS